MDLGLTLLVTRFATGIAAFLLLLFWLGIAEKKAHHYLQMLLILLLLSNYSYSFLGIYSAPVQAYGYIAFIFLKLAIGPIWLMLGRSYRFFSAPHVTPIIWLGFIPAVLSIVYNIYLFRLMGEINFSTTAAMGWYPDPIPGQFWIRKIMIYMRVEIPLILFLIYWFRDIFEYRKRRIRLGKYFSKAEKRHLETILRFSLLYFVLINTMWIISSARIYNWNFLIGFNIAILVLLIIFRNFLMTFNELYTFRKGEMETIEEIYGLKYLEKEGLVKHSEGQRL
jgi:hypothetical protein